MRLERSPLRSKVARRIFALFVLCALLPLWYHGLLTGGVVLLSLALVPFYSGGTWLGARFFNERGREHFRPAALMVLAAVALATLLLAAQDL